jgi:radical SAM-linked protein
MRVRIRFGKVGKVRFTGHRDVARVLERSLRKAGVRVAYSEGFTPRPRLSFGLALPTGAESIAEYADVMLADQPDGEVLTADELAARLDAALPSGFSVLAASELAPGVASLQEDVVACTWEIVPRGLGAQEVAAAVAAALAADTLPLLRERKGEARVDDLRPAIESLVVRDAQVAGDPPAIVADLATRPRGMRPSELLAVCFPAAAASAGESLLAARVLRTHQWIERDGARRELLPLDAADASRTPQLVRA